ncbi:hypothetical protein HCN44_006369 [Aphidius gifuensis]|uniref:Glucose-methanol-choline oxidoreductase N-terminal domain-containing protein n=1 Tax=Aphidius gifuensis TaxID=684658 RepID=A0A834XY68_APHGI|nr:hypothetical protein HCN44_006369 [Aphidius gifuensis]
MIFLTLHNLSNFLTLNWTIKLSIVLLNFIVVPSNTQKVYKNMYGDRPFDVPLSNIISTSIGALDFLEKGGKFMSREPPDITPKKNSIYDFIIVGAGTAGATLAARLSEIESFKVLLIEAGRSENLLMDIPVVVNMLQYSDDINWKYSTEPSEKYCRAMNNNSCLWPRGKVMGGSSILNYMIATRGHPNDYDNWANMGNLGWSWKDVLPYFKKLETMGINKFNDNKELHNDNGPVHINYPPFHTPIATAFVDAGLELGYKYIDYNGKEFVGFSYLQTTMKNGTRHSSSRAYLHPIKDRPNLTVTKNSLVKQLLFDSSKKRIIGVKFRKMNKIYYVYAKKEVILSAGAIGSPQILMLSGIGPEKHLKNMGIDTIVDTPVGENLMDHIAYGGLIFKINQPVTPIFWEMINIANPYIKDFMLNRTGPLTMVGGCEAIAFVDTDRPNDHSAYPNIELLFVSSSFASHEIVLGTYGISDDFWKKTYSKYLDTNTVTVYPMILRPKSRGKILLRSKNINDKPKIYPNYMSNKEDVKTLIAGIRLTLKISKTTAMKNFGTEIINIPLPGCEEFDYDTDEFWECGLRSLTFNIYHYSGTCKMGPQNDPTSVVNSKLKVYGVEGLRVVDASIFPSLMSGHPNIPIFMIAEKISDIIKQEYPN